MSNLLVTTVRLAKLIKFPLCFYSQGLQTEMCESAGAQRGERGETLASVSRLDEALARANSPTAPVVSERSATTVTGTNTDVAFADVTAASYCYCSLVSDVIRFT